MEEVYQHYMLVVFERATLSASAENEGKRAPQGIPAYPVSVSVDLVMRRFPNSAPPCPKPSKELELNMAVTVLVDEVGYTPMGDQPTVVLWKPIV